MFVAVLMVAVALALHPVGLLLALLGFGLVGIVTTTVGMSFKVGGETISGSTNCYHCQHQGFRYDQRPGCHL